MAMRRVIALVPVMDQHEFFQPVKQEKSGHQRDHCARGIEPLHLRQSENLRQDVEAHDAEEDAGGEGENKMHSAAELERKEPPGNSGAEGGKREQECGHRSVAERSCARTASLLLDLSKLPFLDHPGQDAEGERHSEKKRPEPRVAERQLALDLVGEGGQAGKSVVREPEANQAEPDAKPHPYAGGNFHGAIVQKKTPGLLSLAGRLNHRAWIHAMEEDPFGKSIAPGSIKVLTAH